MAKIIVNYAQEGDWWLAWIDQTPGTVGRGRTKGEAYRDLMGAITAREQESPDEALLDIVMMEDMFEG